MEAENTTLDFSRMNDAALEASLSDDEYTPEEGADAPEDTPEAAAGQEPTEGDDEGQAPEGKQPADEAQATEQQKLVDLRALQEERELRKQERDRAAALEVELARYRQQEAASLAAQHDADVQAQYDQIYLEQGEEAAGQFIRSVTQQRETELQQQFQHQHAVNTLLMSEEMVREVDPAYDTRFERMREVLGPQALLAVIDRALRESPRAPAKWLNDHAKANYPLEADRKAAIDAEVQRRLAELQGKNKPPAVRGHQSIGHISSGTQNPGATKPIRKMSDAELERSLND